MSHQTCSCFPGTCRGGDVVEGRLPNGLACKKHPPALAQFIDGLLASLGHEPTKPELRAAAHALTVRADRIACAAARANQTGDGA